MRLNSFLIVLLLVSSSCSISIIDAKRTKYENCIVKMREADVPPLKALRICGMIHDKDSQDLEDEE